VNQSRLAEEMTDYAYYKAKKNSKYPLTKRSRCGIMNVQGKGRTPSPSQKKVKKKLKKPLDKLHRVWYNKDTKRETSCE
jgi:hypothetical protein